jgi:uncharacterized protein YndB with AHSA1/START domain
VPLSRVGNAVAPVGGVKHPADGHRAPMTTQQDSSRSVSESVVVAAAPEEIFALLADPHRHPEIDGSGTVRAAVRGPQRLRLGSTFGMRMQIGLPYLIRNTVVEFEENRRIAWRHFGRHVWRYQLEPVEGGTRVTETFDWSTAAIPKMVEIAGFPKTNSHGITATLERLRARFANL